MYALVCHIPTCGVYVPAIVTAADAHPHAWSARLYSGMSVTVTEAFVLVLSFSDYAAAVELLTGEDVLEATLSERTGSLSMYSHDDFEYDHRVGALQRACCRLNGT